MTIRLALAFTTVFAVPGTMRSTTCATLPPCARIHSQSTLFTGTVVAADVPLNDRDRTPRIARVKVEEVFEGLPFGTDEVSVSSSGWFERGKTYVFDVAKQGDGIFVPVICGSSGELGSKYSTEFIDFLRQRKAGKVGTSLNVYVVDRNNPVSDVNVTIIGSKSTRSGKTDATGNTKFANVEPGSYRVQVSREFYEPDPDFRTKESADVLGGTCAGNIVGLKAQGIVSGLVRDSRGAPMRHLPLELSAVRDQPGFSIGDWFSTETDEIGVFHFTAVSPGRYYMGTNLLDYSRSASIPRVFYPGSRSRDGAVPVEVALGGSVENLMLTLPDFGPLREIRFLVVDDSGRPISGAVINDAADKDSDLGALGRDLKTDDKGQLIAHGFEGVHYRVIAVHRNADFRQARFSEKVDIAPGKGLFESILVLKAPRPLILKK